MTLKPGKMWLLLGFLAVVIATVIWGDKFAHHFRADTLSSWVPAHELALAPERREQQNLTSVEITDRVSGAVFTVHFDRDSTSIAKESIPFLAFVYREVAQLLVVSPSNVEWDAVLFARNSKDLVLANKPWDMDVGVDGRLSESGDRSLHLTVPHEQAHSTQDGVKELPRWFTEGQASWVEMKFAEKWAPKWARTLRDEYTAALKEFTAPIALGQWGGVIVKDEAFLRQMTPEQRVQFKKDGVLPSGGGHWSFKPGDYVSDESNIRARYAAALVLFERIEKQAGRDALQAWFKAVRGAKVPITNEAVASLALTHTRLDISADLK